MSDHAEALHLADTIESVLLIPPGASLNGLVMSSQTQHLLLEGRFCGRMVLGGASRVEIAAGAEIEAESLEAHTLVVHGTVSGHLAGQFIELGPTAKVTGSLRYSAAFACQPGARLRASIEGPEEGNA